ncbi:MAG: oligosaccharide flippase family protein [bacterium]|nr:oligosaccharide flippase family protein [bacterium]
MGTTLAERGEPVPGEPFPGEPGRPRGILGHLMSTAATDGLTFVLGIASSILINRALLPEGRGHLAAVMSLLVVAGTAFGFGVTKSFLHYLNADASGGEAPQKGAAVGAAFTVLPLSILLGAALLLGFGPDLPDGIAVPVYALALAYFCVMRGNDVTSNALHAVRRIHAINAAKTAQQVTRVLLVSALFATGALTVPAALGIELATQMLVLAITMRVLFAQRELRPRWAGVRAVLPGMLAYGFAYQAYTILWTTQLKIDVVLLKEWGSAQAAGLYATAVNWSDLVVRIPAVVLFVLTPHLAQLGSDTEGLAKSARSVRMLLPLLVLLAAGLAALAPWLMRVLYGVEFEPSGGSLRILLPGTVCMSLFLILTTQVVVARRFAPLIAVATVGLLLNVALNRALIPERGASGAALASSITYALSFALLLAVQCVRYRTSPLVFLVPRPADWRPLFALLGSKRGGP